MAIDSAKSGSANHRIVRIDLYSRVPVMQERPVAPRGAVQPAREREGYKHRTKV